MMMRTPSSIDPRTDDELVDSLRVGELSIIPTDTLYGLVASALDPNAVERIYELKRRDPAKPLILLIAQTSDVERFGIVLTDALRAMLDTYWPGPYSIVLPTIDDEFAYLDRGTRTIAFRVPDDEGLRDLLRRTGALVAPSANVEGGAPARTVAEAKRYFGTDVAHYIDGGELNGPASTLLEIDEGGRVHTLRP